MKRYSYIFISAAICIFMTVAFFFPNQGKTVTAWTEHKYRVVIDAGHGGIDGGAVGYTGVLEKTVNLDIALKCELLMQLLGVDVVMTRREDTSLDDGTGPTIARRKADDIKARVALAGTGVCAYVSIHMNSFTQSKYWGTQTFYSKNNDQSMVLAEHLQTTAREYIAPDNNREIKQAPDEIYLMKHVMVPAVIIECGFLSNPEEEALLASGDYQKKMAIAICGGTLAFLNIPA